MSGERQIASVRSCFPRPRAIYIHIAPKSLLCPAHSRMRFFFLSLFPNPSAHPSRLLASPSVLRNTGNAANPPRVNTEVPAAATGLTSFITESRSGNAAATTDEALDLKTKTNFVCGKNPFLFAEEPIKLSASVNLRTSEYFSDPLSIPQHLWVLILQIITFYLSISLYISL